MNKTRYLTAAILIICSNLVVQAAETTQYGKIVGIETRTWGLHVQTDFAAGSSLGCPVSVGGTYMYDFQYGNSLNSLGAEMEKSVLLSAFAAGKEVSFHMYNCNSPNSRPVIGYIRIR